jgi:hypothetical protein
MIIRNSKYRTSLFFLLILLTCFVLSCSPPIAGVVLPSSTSLEPDKESNSSPEQSPVVQYTPATPGDAWSKVTTASGESGKKDLTFDISGNKWCIAWCVEGADSESSLFNLTIYRADTSAPIKVYTQSGTIPGDTLYINEGNNAYLVKITTANVDRWAVTVGEEPVTEPVSPVRISRIQYQGTEQKVYPHDLNACYKRNEPDEYVVIENESDTWQDIRGWSLINETKGYPSFTFPEYFNACPVYYTNYHNAISAGVQPIPCILGPYQVVYIYTDEFNSETGGFHFNYAPGDIWNNDRADVAVLYDNEGQEISRRSYIIENENDDLPPVYIARVEYEGTPYSVENEAGPYFRTVEYDEYVVISNRSTCFQDMSRWTLKNDTKGFPSFMFPDDYYICPGETIRVYTNEIHPEWSGYCFLYYPNELIQLYTEIVHDVNGDTCSFFPLATVPPHGDCSFHYDPGDIWDNNSPDVAVLYNSAGKEISRKSYRINN